MSRSPFFPALFAFLFSSLFSFATTAVEGDWERLDGGAPLRLKLDSDGRLHASLTEAQIGTQHTPIAGQAPRRRTFRGSDRLHLKHARSRETSAWKRIS